MTTIHRRLIWHKIIKLISSLNHKYSFLKQKPVFIVKSNFKGFKKYSLSILENGIVLRSQMYLKVAGQAKMEKIRTRRRRRDRKVMETLNANKIHHQAQSEENL